MISKGHIPQGREASLLAQGVEVHTILRFRIARSWILTSTWETALKNRSLTTWLAYPVSATRLPAQPGLRQLWTLALQNAPITTPCSRWNPWGTQTNQSPFIRSNSLKNLCRTMLSVTCWLIGSGKRPATFIMARPKSKTVHRVLASSTSTRYSRRLKS